MGVMLKLYTVLQSVNWSATQVSHRIVVIKDCFAENDLIDVFYQLFYPRV